MMFKKDRKDKVWGHRRLVGNIHYSSVPKAYEAVMECMGDVRRDQVCEKMKGKPVGEIQCQG
jgi:hypothetical protein